MIINLVGRYNRMGKTALAIMAQEKLGIKYRQLTGPLKAATGMFVETYLEKEQQHPELGISKREIGDAISAALTTLHHDLPVYLASKAIEELARSNYHVILDDVRRLSEFVWLDKLAEETGTTHAVIEIVPFPDEEHYPLPLKLDTWSNGAEPCGEAAWPVERLIMVNDGTDGFFASGILELAKLIERETERLANAAT